ncbi:flagellar motor control protein ZomB [Mycobacterium sp. EPa45]|uniref:flagellar motor control protein ZomB n=1 Tax=Mycobacterium sp. EPa45 TaxID=1545728 RepID=UPI000641CFE2|nr:flagellar motor control protein ZomB [Mycobacterium sp. EPa45]AKK30928.1 membrane protein [Mycobacterium sp. EPa45]
MTPEPASAQPTYLRAARISLWVSVGVVAALWTWGAWQRRWIADDGLIVLRTVRNLLAGNGPVFNAGERVESNTSTLWTYLNYVGALIAGPVQLEYVALALALSLSVAGVVFVMLGTARLFAPGLQGRRAVFLPAGALVYIAIPPARDFATSGLENGLVLAWIGLLWWMMVVWSQQPRLHRSGPVFTAALAFVAGLSVLVRPELALIGGLALVMILIAARGWITRLLILVAGGLFPVGYQIFRMGYYGLLFPQTALAKDASGDKWGQGLIYLANFNQPYALWLAALLVMALGAMVVAARRAAAGPPDASRSARRLARRIQSPTAVVIFMLVSGVLQALYWIRQGGDFMHGRVLLTPVFCLLTPVALIPVVLPDAVRFSRERATVLAGTTVALWLALVGWSLWAANSPGMGRDATRVTYSGIVDERRFYSQATGHAHPLTAADYLDYPRMRAVLTAINNTPDGALLLPAGNYDVWDVVPAYPPPPPPPGVSMDTWRRQIAPHTVFFTNLGMLGMNVGLNVRVIDQIGLANPIAAHTARLEDGRIGHDKNLFPDWAVAEGPWLKEHPYVPPYLDEGWIAEAGVALGCPETDAMLKSIRAPLGVRRFVSNVLHALDFTRYRIDRVPQYELQRCNLPEPPLKGTPYTGLPATGP